MDVHVAAVYLCMRYAFWKDGGVCCPRNPRPLVCVDCAHCCRSASCVLLVLLYLCQGLREKVSCSPRGLAPPYCGYVLLLLCVVFMSVVAVAVTAVVAFPPPTPKPPSVLTSTPNTSLPHRRHGFKRRKRRIFWVSHLQSIAVGACTSFTGIPNPAWMVLLPRKTVCLCSSS